jgi:hypothetical protein
MTSGGNGVKRDVVGAASKEKWWEQRQKRSGQSFYGCDDVAGVTYASGNVAMHQPKVRTATLPTNPNLAPTPARPTTISNNPTTAPPPTPYAMSTATPGVRNTLRSADAAPPPQIANAAYIAPIAPRPLLTNMRQHGTTPGHQFEPVDVFRNTSSAAYAVVNASRITGAAHLIPEEPSLVGATTTSHSKREQKR